MHVARIRHLFYPDLPRDYFYELSAQQVKRGHDVDVVSWRRNDACSEERVAEGFTIHRLNGLNLNFGGLIQEYPYLPELPSKLEELRPDVVHGESHLFLPTVQAVRKAKQLGLPCVVTVHGVFASRGRIINFLQDMYLHTLGLELFKEVDRIICLTRSDIEEIVRLGSPLEKIALIPNAVDADFFKPGKDREGNLVVWVGRFVHEKGLKYFVEVAEKISKEKKDVHFLLVGYGPLKTRVMNTIRAKKSLRTKTNFVGPLSRDAVAEILGKTTVFVFPSLKEGMPLSLLEAMSCGAAVVAFRIPSVAEVIEDGREGVLVSPKDSESMAKAVIHLLEDKCSQEILGIHARQKIIRKHCWSVVLRDLDKLYKEII